MSYNILSPAESINTAYRRQNIVEADFLNFISQLDILKNKINPDESEEHLKAPLRDFF